MSKINVISGFRHCDLWEVHPREYPPGAYDVVEGPTDGFQCSPRCAEVALAEGWAEPVAEAKPAAEPKPARPTGSRAGTAKRSPSSAPARRSTKAKPKKSAT